MCYNLSLTQRREKMTRIYGADPGEGFFPGYLLSGFDHPELPLLRLSDGQRVFEWGSWGLIPPWATEESLPKLRISTLNARWESAWEKPSFREPVKTGRVVIPFTGFFEWKQEGRRKIPYFIGFTDQENAGGLGGLAEVRPTPEGPKVTFSLITVPPGPLMSAIHNRSPLVLAPEQWDQWLDHSTSRDVLETMAQPRPWPDMKAYPVGDLISRRGVNRNTPEVLSPRGVDAQGLLF